VAVCSFNIVTNDRKKDDSDQWIDVDPTWFRCTAWRQLAENAAESLHKGDLVIVVGRLRQNAYKDKEGNDAVSYQNVNVFSVGPSLAFVTATINKAEKGSTSAPKTEGDPWESAPKDSDAPPF
jgi:single-strand DNA-binding protein